MSDPRRLLLLATLATLPLGPAEATGDRLSAYLWTKRVVVALAPTRDDPALAVQRRIFQGFGAEGRDRDLVLVEATDGTPDGAALRRRFGGGTGFRAVLLDKDGGEKLISQSPLGRDDLFPLIDAMPMRRDEMARKP